MSVLTREALESSPLADLHALAAELKIDGFRRLRKSDLVDTILGRQAGDDVVAPVVEDEFDAQEEAPRAPRDADEDEVPAAAEDEGDDEDAAPAADEDEDEAPAARSDDEDEAPRRRRGRRGGRGRSRRAVDEDGATDEDAGPDTVADAGEPEAAAPRRRRRAAEADVETGEPEGERDRAPRRRREEEPERVAEGVVELLGNGSGFVRVDPPEPSEEDVYISAGQVRRCELVSGDRVSGPVRPPRRSERYPSLVRIDTINGAPADEVAEGTPYDEQPATFPSERLALGSEDPTLKAIEWLTPIGRGSRVVITGGAGAGKTEALRLLAGALAGTEGLDVSVVLAGVRPEEITLWQDDPARVAGALSFGSGADALGQLVERAVETAKRLVTRGEHAILLIDTLDALHVQAARRALAAARALRDGGSLTIIATAKEPFGGETTVIALDSALTLTRRFPALDLVRSATVRPELLVGDAGADAIAQARAQALGASGS